MKLVPESSARRTTAMAASGSLTFGFSAAMAGSFQLASAHCPRAPGALCTKCQASAAHRWLEARQADLLPVEYYHVVFTLPAPISAIDHQLGPVERDLEEKLQSRDRGIQ